jgi:predicted XRE-type DNA-binding protein
MSQRTKRPHVTKGNVLDDLGFSPEESFELKVKSELHSAILKLIRKRGYTPQQLERVLNIPQPRVSELMRGKLHLLGLNKLAEYADLLGGDPRVKVSLAQKSVA